MGWLTGRSRAPSDDRPFEVTVGRPTLQFTDAQPRHDLQALGQISTAPRPPTARNGSVGPNDADRPKTSGGTAQQTSQPSAHAPKSFNLYPAESPRFKPAGLAVTTKTDNASIGMALGSPTHPPQRQAPQTYNSSPLLNSDALVHDEHLFDDLSARNKSGKWKKIGGLFKAKQAFANQGQQSPFYSLHNQYAASVSPDLKPPSTDTWPLPQPPPRGMAPKAQKVTGHGLDSRQNFGGRRSEWDRSKEPIEMSKSKQQPNVNTHGRRGSFGNPHDNSTALKNFESSAMFSKGGAFPSLDVDIPDSQMERYSVMFSGLLGGSSSNLLARRSRMLEKLRTIDDETSQHKKDDANALSLPHGPRDQSRLAPRPQTRRATSPSKSPSFNLFPNTDTDRDGRRSPVPRSFTAPARLSPMQETFEHEEKDDVRRQLQSDADFISSPSQTASSTTNGQKYSTDSSFISPASTRESVDEDDIIFNVKPLHSLSEFEEQQWELMSSENLTKPMPKTLQPKPQSKLRDQFLDREMASTKKVEVKQLRAKTRDSHEETLAALERPVPRGQDLAPLQATKAAIDRIMSPPAPKDRKKLSDPSVEDSATSVAVEDAIRKLNEPLVRKLSQKDEPTPTAFPVSNPPTTTPYVPKLKVRNRSNTVSSTAQPESIAAISSSQPYVRSIVDTHPPLTDETITAFANDLDELEHQIESRAVRAMKKQYGSSNSGKSKPATADDFPKPSSAKPNGLIQRPTRSATDDLKNGAVGEQGESRAVRAARKQAADLAKAKSTENLAAPSKSAQSFPSPPRSVNSAATSSTSNLSANHAPNLNTTSFISAPSSGTPTPSPSPSPASAEVQVARSISLSKKPKQLLVPVGHGHGQGHGHGVAAKKALSPVPVWSDPTRLTMEDGETLGQREVVRTPTIVEPERDDGDGRPGYFAGAVAAKGFGGAIVGSGGGGGGGGKGRGDYGRMRGHRVERSVGVVIESA